MKENAQQDDEYEKFFSISMINDKLKPVNEMELVVEKEEQKNKKMDQISQFNKVGNRQYLRWNFNFSAK